MMGEQDKFSYRFTPEVLETIIDKNLTLFQYFQHLHRILRSKFQSQSPQAPQPLTQAALLLPSQSYSYEQIEQCLECREFIENLHPNMNSLLTTTNIGIVRQTLRIYMLVEGKAGKYRALGRVRDVVNIFTLHQIDKNVTHLLADLHSLNAILFKIGLLITRSQFQFYHAHLWGDLPEESVELGHALSSRKQALKQLQIHHLLPLAIEMEEVSAVKNNLRQWLNSEEFEKYHSHRVRLQRERSKAEGKRYLEENMSVVKLRIQYLEAAELLREVEQRGYDIDKCHKSYEGFRRDLLEAQRKENESKKIFNAINAKTCKKMPTPEANRTGQVSKNKSRVQKEVIIEKPEENRQKLEQEAFNRKILNGCFIRDQIGEDIAEGRVEFLDCYQGAEGAEDPNVVTQSCDSVLKSCLANTMELKKGVVIGKSHRGKRKINQQSAFKTGTGFDLSGTASSISSHPPTPAKKQTTSTSENFFERINQKLRSEVFFGLGHKILNKRIIR